MRREAKLLVSALVLAGGTAACDEGTGPDASVDEQVAYIDAIVPHHQIATMRADEALAKAVHPGLKNIASRMKEDQGREIAQFKEIRRTIAGSDETPAPMQPKEIPPGPNFDREWILGMLNHHQGAIDMSTLGHGTGLEARLDSLAHHTIEEQRVEQQELRDSLRVWYGQ